MGSVLFLLIVIAILGLLCWRYYFYPRQALPSPDPMIFVNPSFLVTKETSRSGDSAPSIGPPNAFPADSIPTVPTRDGEPTISPSPESIRINKGDSNTSSEYQNGESRDFGYYPENYNADKNDGQREIVSSGNKNHSGRAQNEN